MENQRKPLPIVMGINIGIILISALMNGNTSDWSFISGMVALGLVFINFIVGIGFSVTKRYDVSKALFLASGLCCLLSFGLCASGLGKL